MIHVNSIGEVSGFFGSKAILKTRGYFLALVLVKLNIAQKILPAVTPNDAKFCPKNQTPCS